MLFLHLKASFVAVVLSYVWLILVQQCKSISFCEEFWGLITRIGVRVGGILNFKFWLVIDSEEVYFYPTTAKPKGSVIISVVYIYIVVCCTANP